MGVLERAEFEVKTFGHTSKESGLNMMLEITRLRQLLSEAEKREAEARAKALEEADQICTKALSEGSPIHPIAVKYITGIRNALSALQSEGGGHVTSK